MRLPLYRVEAVVLFTEPWGEQDRKVTLYSLEKGKIEVLAKGGRRMKSKLSPSIDPPTHGGFLLRRMRIQPDIIEETWIINSFPGLRINLFKLGYTFFFLELVKKLGGEEANPPLFKLLLSCFYWMEKISLENLPSLFLTFQILLSRYLGWGPELYKCVICGEDKTENSLWYFDTPEGGIVCPLCKRKAKSPFPLSPRFLSFLRKIFRGEILKRVKVGSEELKIDSFLTRYLSYHGETKFNSPHLISLIYGL